MKTAQTARRSEARGLVVGVVAALVVALGAGTEVAAQPIPLPTYNCEDGAGGSAFTAGVRCQALNGAPQQGEVLVQIVITFPTGTWTCLVGTASMPVMVVGRSCTS